MGLVEQAVILFGVGKWSLVRFLPVVGAFDLAYYVGLRIDPVRIG